MNRRHFIAHCGAGIAGLPLVSWAIEAPRARPLRFAFFTDVHARVEWDTPAGMARAAAAINAAKPDFIIAGGDLITDGFQPSAATVAPRWEAYMGMHNALEAEVHPAIGNHDLVAARPEDGTVAADNPRKPFLEHMGLERTWRSFDAAGTHVVFLDTVHITNDTFKYHGFVTDEQLAWLKEDLAGVAADTPIIVVTHMPLLSVFNRARRGNFDPERPNRIVTNNRDVIAAFHARNVVLVLQGHLHVDEFIRYRGTTYITGGAVCGQWWRGPRSGTEEGFGIVTLRPGQVDWQYVDYGWEARRPAGT